MFCLSTGFGRREHAEPEPLRRENAELRRANEILRTARSFAVGSQPARCR